MTNRKLKPGKVHFNIQCRIAFETGTRNLMTMYLCLHKLGVSKNKIMQIDDDLTGETVKRYKQDVADDVGDVKIRRFLHSVDIEYEALLQLAANMGIKYLIPAKFDKQQIAAIVESFATDLAMYLYELNAMLGYGHERLNRVLGAMAMYKGDALKEATETFGFYYGDEQEIPDIVKARERHKTRLDGDIASKLKAQWA